MKDHLVPALALLVGTMIGLVSMWAAIGVRRDDGAICYDTTRIIDAGGAPVRCERADQLMLERPIGYGRAMVTCSCMKKPTDDPNAPAFIELTDDEKKMLEEARDAGELDSKDGGPL